MLPKDFNRKEIEEHIKLRSTNIISRNYQDVLLNEMNALANYSLTSLGVEYNFVYIEPVDNEIIPVAGALGVCIDNNWLINKKMSFGKILVNLSVMSQLNSSERLFIISHECAHIFHNHLIATMLVNIPSLSLKILDLISTNPYNKVLLSSLKSMMSIMNRFNVKNNIDSIKNQELEADMTALEITQDFSAAKSCLLKLCNNDPNSLSHYFEFESENESEKIPVMTVNQRIQSWYEY